MDPKFVALLHVFQETNKSLYLSCIVQGILVTGFIISEQRYFVEMNRIMNDEVKSSSETRKYFEDLFLSTSKIPLENVAVHLAAVMVYLPNKQQHFPVLRIDPSQVSAWAFLPPEENEASPQLIARLLRVNLEDVDL